VMPRQFFENTSSKRITLSSRFKIPAAQKPGKEKEERNRRKKEQNRFVATNSLAAPVAPGDPLFFSILDVCLVSFRRSLNSSLPRSRGSKSTRTGALRV